MRKNLMLISLLLSGCANIPGVLITDDERKACEASSCSVWTFQELQNLARKFFKEGYQAGVSSI